MVGHHAAERRRFAVLSERHGIVLRAAVPPTGPAEVLIPAGGYRLVEIGADAHHHAIPFAVAPDETRRVALDP